MIVEVICSLGRRNARVNAFVVHLEIFELLRQRQFLFDGHAQQGIQRLLFFFGSVNLTLKFVQLCDVLVAACCEHRTQRCERRCVLFERFQFVT